MIERGWASRIRIPALLAVICAWAPIARAASDDQAAALQGLQDLAGRSGAPASSVMDPVAVQDTATLSGFGFTRSRRGAPSSVAAPKNSGGPAGFNAEKLFGKWGDDDVVQFKGDGGLDSQPRTYSIRMASFWAPSAPSPEVTASTSASTTLALVDYIAVYDISNPSDIYGKIFDLNGNSGDIDKGGVNTGQPFQLDTRAYANNTPRSYTLTIESKGGEQLVIFSLQRPQGGAGAYAVNAKGYVLTINQLRRMRREHAKNSGITSLLDGTTYYVMPESAGLGCWQFFDKSDDAAVEPLLFGCVNRKAAGQQETLLPSVVAGTEFFGQRGNVFYSLWYDPAMNAVRVMASKLQNPNATASTVDEGSTAVPSGGASGVLSKESRGNSKRASRTLPLAPSSPSAKPSPKSPRRTVRRSLKASI